MTENLASGDLEWTGERYLPRIGGGIELEHRHRYAVACQLAAGKRVLDIASGEGYGSNTLAEVAGHVTGVDISQEAVTFARSKYRRPNLEFKVGSCAQIPLDDHSVDVVVSFETIEHHTQHHEMMREIKRVLAPGGILIISSPDKLEYSDRTGYNNPFHVQELYRDEFTGLLNQYFQSHFLMGQRVIYGSAIISEGVSSQFLSAASTEDQAKLVPDLQHAVYLLAVASDSTLPCALSSLLEVEVMASDAARWMANEVETVRRSEREWQASASEWEQRCLEAKAAATQASVAFDQQTASLTR